jgi:uncharacterized protein
MGSCAMETREHLKELHKMIQLIIETLVDNPDQIEITIRPEPYPAFQIRVAATEVGKVIGKQGRTARAIRELLHEGSKNLPRPVGMNLLEAE